ncbi:MAG: hypothetical protein DRJ05_20555, partial [Bacteroidetes bacterium]
MKKTILFFLLIPLFGFAQGNPITDSLNQLLLKAKPEEKALILCELSKLYSEENNAEKALQLAVEAQGLSKQINSKKGETMAISRIGLAHFYLGNNEKAKEYFLQSISMFISLKDHYNQAQDLHNLASVYYRENDYQKSLEYFKEITSVENINQHPTLLAETYMDIGVNYYRLGELDSALLNYTISHKLFEKTNDKEKYRNLLNRIGVLYYAKGDYDKAVEYMLMVLAINEKTGNKVGMATVNGNIGAVYYKNSDYEKAIDHYLKAIE